MLAVGVRSNAPAIAKVIDVEILGTAFALIQNQLQTLQRVDSERVVVAD